MSAERMETTKAKSIVGLAGNLRSGSFNRQLLAAAAHELPADATFEEWDGLERVPPFTRTSRAHPHRWWWRSSGVPSGRPTGC
jgi:NAD(P)H-dependent FMN reductase